MFDVWQQCLKRAAEIVAAVKAQYPGGEGVQCGGTVDVPKAPTYGGLASTSQSQYQKYAPQVLSMEAQYRPAYAALGLSTEDAYWNGVPAQAASGGYNGLTGQTYQLGGTGYQGYATQDYAGALAGFQWSGTDPKKYAKAAREYLIKQGFNKEQVTRAYENGDFGIAPASAMPAWVQSAQQATAATPAQRGMLSILQDVSPALSKLQTESNTAARTANVNDLAALGPQALAAYKSYNPIYSRLADSALQELDLGGMLSPEQQRTINTQMDANYARRGLYRSPLAANATAGYAAQASDALQNQRRQFAAGVQGMTPDVSSLVLGGTGAATSTLGTILGQGNTANAQAASGPGMFSIIDPTLASLANSQWNANVQQANANGTGLDRFTKGWGQVTGMIGDVVGIAGKVAGMG